MLDLRKPEPGSGREARRIRAAERRAEQEKADRKVEREEAAAWTAIRHLVYLRDHRRCRAFGTPTIFLTDDLFKLAHVHHILYRSQGGGDTLDNLILLGYAAHKLVHDGLLDIFGDANGKVTFKQYEYAGGTRRLVRTWEG